VSDTAAPSPEHSLGYEMLFFIALLATALALGGALAHAFELPNKIGLPREEYFIVQKAYRGWNQLAYVLAVQIGSILSLILLSRRERRIVRLIVGALLCLAAAQAIFWIWTFPANVATRNWTFIPANWATLRAQWEYSHLAGAVFQLLVMSLLIVAVLRRGRLSTKGANLTAGARAP
jgi:hypothetical protein